MRINTPILIKLHTWYVFLVMAGEKDILARQIGRNSERSETKQISATKKWPRRREGKMAANGDVQIGTSIESLG